MMRDEFVKYVREFASKNGMSEKAETQLLKLSTADYPVVELVYTYHPAISDTRGKEEIAALFVVGGIAVIYDMLPRAELARDLTTERDILASKMQSVVDQYEMLKKGPINGNS
jgi:hypothetical protein